VVTQCNLVAQQAVRPWVRLAGSASAYSPVPPGLRVRLAISAQALSTARQTCTGIGCRRTTLSVVRVGMDQVSDGVGDANRGEVRDRRWQAEAGGERGAGVPQPIIVYATEARPRARAGAWPRPEPAPWLSCVSGHEEERLGVGNEWPVAMREVMLDRPEAGGACDACSFNVNHSLAERRKLPFEKPREDRLRVQDIQKRSRRPASKPRDSLHFRGSWPPPSRQKLNRSAKAGRGAARAGGGPAIVRVNSKFLTGLGVTH